MNRELSSTSRFLTLGIAVGLGIALAMPSCAEPEQVTNLTIDQVRDNHESELMAIEGVTGIGIGECDGKPCLLVFVEEETEGLKNRLPPQLDGFQVSTQVTGSLLEIQSPMQDDQGSSIEQVMEKHESELMAIEGVTGIGIGECNEKPCIKVFVVEDSPDITKQIPSQIDGFKVSTELTGTIDIQPTKRERNPK